MLYAKPPHSKRLLRERSRRTSSLATLIRFLLNSGAASSPAHIPGATLTIIEGEGHRPLLRTGGRADGKHRGGEFAELVLRLISEE